MPKIPTWLKIIVPLLLFIVLLVVTAAWMWSEELPEEVQLEAIQTHFAEQIAVLEELVGTLPLGACDARHPPSPESAREITSTLSSWQANFQARADLFADPAILGVKVFRTCHDSQMDHVLKAYQPALSFSRSMIMPPTTWPAVSLWFIGRQRAVKYEDRMDAGSGETKGFVLTMALEHP
jgi:hypothetical protein